MLDANLKNCSRFRQVVDSEIMASIASRFEPGMRGETIQVGCRKSGNAKPNVKKLAVATTKFKPPRTMAG